MSTNEYCILDRWWIGLIQKDRKTEGPFEWMSGHPLSYTDWSQGPPSQPDDTTFIIGHGTESDCTSLSPDNSFQWADDDCSIVYFSQICEFRSVFIHISK